MSSTQTTRTYNSAKRRYLQFCKDKYIRPLPAAERQLCWFVFSLALQLLCHSTIKSYLTAIRHLHRSPHSQHGKGIKTVQSRGPKRVEQLPITPTLLAKLNGVWSRGPNQFEGLMLWAAASLCFFGFMRSGELTIPSAKSYDAGAHLSFQDVTMDCVHNPRILRVNLKASKTDPFRVGVNVYVGTTGNGLYPVTAVLHYNMVERGPGPGPFFKFEDGSPLTRAKFVVKVKEALSLAGVDCTAYSGHSFRSGAATTAAKQGVSDATIKMLGRWKSSAYQIYIKTPKKQLASYSRHLGGAQ